jgi:hypothetical protein
MTTWKHAERQIAKQLGGRRVPVSGRHHIPHGQVSHGPAGHTSRAVTGHSLYSDGDSDDDPGKPKNPHQNCEKASRTPVDHTSGSSDEPENPHQNCEKALHTCVVCGQAILQVSGQATLYCSTACKEKAYRQRRSSADTPGQGEPAPPAVEKATDVPDPSVCLDCGQRIDAEGFLYRCPPCLQARYDKLGREYPEKLIRWLEARAVRKGGH